MGGNTKPGKKPPSEENKGLHGQEWTKKNKEEKKVTKKTKKEAKQMGASEWVSERR